MTESAMIVKDTNTLSSFDDKSMSNSSYSYKKKTRSRRTKSRPAYDDDDDDVSTVASLLSKPIPVGNGKVRRRSFTRRSSWKSNEQEKKKSSTSSVSTTSASTTSSALRPSGINKSTGQIKVRWQDQQKKTTKPEDDNNSTGTSDTSIEHEDPEPETEFLGDVDETLLSAQKGEAAQVLDYVPEKLSHPGNNRLRTTWIRNWADLKQRVENDVDTAKKSIVSFDSSTLNNARDDSKSTSSRLSRRSRRSHGSGSRAGSRIGSRTSRSRTTTTESPNGVIGTNTPIDAKSVVSEKSKRSLALLRNKDGGCPRLRTTWVTSWGEMKQVMEMGLLPRNDDSSDNLTTHSGDVINVSNHGSTSQYDWDQTEITETEWDWNDDDFEYPNPN